VVFTSANGARFLLQRLRELGLGPEAFGAARVAAVGPATAQHLEQVGLAVDLLPEEHSQEGLARAFARIPVEGQEILFPSSSLSRPMLAAALAQRGARVHQVVAYQNRPPDPSQVEVPAALLGGQVDMAVFASPSSVEHFGELLGCDRALALLSPLALACIGPSTADAVRRLGLQVHVQPEESSAAELAKAICAYYEAQTP
jgi:uroporphyrinogen-III synthase